MRIIFALSLIPIAIACGGHTVDVSDGGSSSDDAAMDSRVSETGPDCAALQAQVDMLREQAITCCPFCKSIQCSHRIQGVCCPLWITSTDAPDFEAAIAEYKAACHPPCPASCPAMQPGMCVSTDPSNPQAPGRCQ